MVAALLRSYSGLDTLSVQEKSILKNASSQEIKVESFFTDFSPPNKPLEERELRPFLKNMPKQSKLLVYDLRVVSDKVGEVVKVFTCLFDKNSSITITSKNITLDRESSSMVMIGLLNQLREIHTCKAKKKQQGRPAGSFSKSKFDRYRVGIIELLQEKKSVSEIARILDVNRSSLKDYIHSRELKQVATSLQKSDVEDILINGEKVATKRLIEQIECPFKKETRR